MSNNINNVSITGSRDIVCNKIFLILNNYEIKDIYDIFALKNDITDITGLPPSTLNTLQELAAAMNNDPNFFQYIRNEISLKRNISDSYDKNYINSLILSYYTKNETDTLLNNKLNSTEINKYYTITQTSSLFVDKATFNINVGDLILGLNLKVNSSDLIEYYYNKTTTNSILQNYYNKNEIDNQFNQYYNITGVNTLLEGYTSSDDFDLTLSIIYSNINSKASITDLTNFYTKTTTNSLLDNYYNKSYVDNTFNKYYNITSLNTLLNNKVDSTTLNNYYDKNYINNSLSNFYQKYQVDGLFNNYYDFTTTNNLYATKNELTNLFITVNSNFNDITNLKNTQLSFLQINSFNNTIGSYLLKSDFTSGSYANITQLNSLNITTSSIINNNNNIYNIVNNNANSITDVSGTLNSVITDVSNIKTTLPSFLQISSFNNTINSYLTINSFTSSSLINTTAFNTLNTNVNNLTNTLPSFLQTTNFNNTINSYLTINNFTSASLINSTDFNNLNTTMNSIIIDTTNIKNTQNSFLQTHIFNNTINSYLTINNFTSASLLNSTNFNNLNATVNSIITDTNNIKNTQNSFLQTSSFNNTINSYLTTSNFNNTINSYLTTSNFNNTISSYLTTANFNNTINSYLPIQTYNNTILTRLNTDFTNITNLQTTTNSIITSLSTFYTKTQTTQLNNLTNYYTITGITNLNLVNSTTLTSQLNLKQIKNIFTIPNISTSWILLGSLNTTQDGNITIVEIYSQNYYSANPIDEIRATIQFSTSNGASFILGNDGTNFYGECSLIATNNVPNTSIAIQQITTTSYNIFYYTGFYPGNSIFNVKSFDTFIYSGTQINPSGCYINPTSIYTIGLNENNVGDMSIDTIRSNSFKSQSANYNIYDNSNNNIATFNLSGSNINSRLQISGNSTMNTNLKVNNNINASTLTVLGNVSSNTLFLTNNATMNTNLKVNNNINASTLTVLGNVSSNTLFLTNNATMNSSLKVVNNISSNTCNTNFLSLGTSQSALYHHNYTTYNSLVLQHPFGMQFAITNSVPPLITTNSNILMSMEADTGVNVNCFLSCETSFSVIGTSNLTGAIISNISCTKSLYISGNSSLNGNLNVLGSTTLKSTFINNTLTVNSSLNTLGPFLCRDNATITSALNISGATKINSDLNVLQNTTLNSSLIVSGNTTLNSNLKVNNIFSTNISCSSLLSYTTASDSFIKIQNNHISTSASSLYFTTNGNTSRIYQDQSGNLGLSVAVSGISSLPINLYANGVINLNGSNQLYNKQVVLYDQGVVDSPSAATNYFGFGINTNTLRYQVPTATQSHKFYCGSTLSFTITNGTGASGSDIRFKSEIQNITNALEKINNIQGKTFLLHENKKRQMGLIAQDILNIVPEVVMVDEDTEEKYLYLQYDKLIALMNEGIKEVNNKVNALEARITALENKNLN